MGQSDPAATALAEDAYRRTIRRYIPAPYAGQVVLFRAQELHAHRTDLGWSRGALSHFKVIVIPGDHHTCIIRHVAAFAGRLEEEMRNAQRDRRIG